MKIAATAYALSFLTGASAFTSNSFKSSRGALKVTENDVPTAGNVKEEQEQAERAVEATATSESSAMSLAMPFLERPAMLDGTLAGDVGFDPLGFAKSQDDLINFRHAEIKHARLAMLAAAGWPLSELFDKKLATWVGMTPIVDASDRAPSVLNGGLGKISPIYWAGCLTLASAIELYGLSRKDASVPGDLGFDPLGLYPKDKEGQLEMQLKEIKNGRLAMIAIVAFAAQEFVQKIGVVDKTPIFFKPLSTVLQEYANSGYIIPHH